MHTAAPHIVRVGSAIVGTRVPTPTWPDLLVAGVLLLVVLRVCSRVDPLLSLAVGRK
jgi:hypothetical protein